MNIALDVSSLNHRHISGVGVYTVELLKALRQNPNIQIQPFWRLSRWKYRREFQHHVGKTRPWLGGLGTHAEIVHGPDFKVIAAPGRKRVVTIHDLAFFREGMTSPEFAAKKRRELDLLLKNHTPDAIITVSESTRRDLIQRYPELASRATAIPLGGDHIHLKPLNQPPEPKFLFVGNLEARKNLLGILRAFEIHAQSAGGGKSRLTLVGKPGFEGERILQALDKSPVRERIERIGYCSGEELEGHYARAAALVYPSWIEGFGIPVIEAMMAGCPVITSSTTAASEIVGREAWLVDPADALSIAGAMDQALSESPAARAARIDRARRQAENFTWGRCAERTLDVYKGLV